MPQTAARGVEFPLTEATGCATPHAQGHTRVEITATHDATPASAANARLEKVGQSFAPNDGPTPASINSSPP